MTALVAADEDEARLELERLGCTDGLPIVVPTAQRVERMVLASGLDADLSLGDMPPRGGTAMVEAIAANAVMAGCIPDDLPLLLAAVAAVLEPIFDLNEVQATTNAVAPLLIVNGPVRHVCELSASNGALGPGRHGNLRIGRAFRLVLMNIGGGVPGEGDMALLGHGGKLACCLAEAEEDSPFRPLHVARGFAREDSVVTVVGAEVPQSITHAPLTDAKQSADVLLTLVAEALTDPGYVSAYNDSGSPVVVFNPDHADLLASAGLGREEIVEGISRRTSVDAATLRRFNPAVPLRVSVPEPVADEFVFARCRPENIQLVVAGARGAYSWIFSGWGIGPHGTVPVSKPIDLEPSCALPWMRDAEPDRANRGTGS